MRGPNPRQRPTRPTSCKHSFLFAVRKKRGALSSSRLRCFLSSRGWCFLYIFVWASAVACPDHVKPVHFLSVDITSCQVKRLVDHIHPTRVWKKKQRLSFRGVCHLYRKRTKKSLFLIISVHLLTVIGSHFLRIFVNLYNDSDPFGPVCLLFTWICFHISEGVSGKWLLLPTEEMWGRVQDILWVRRKWGLALRNQM